MEVSSIFSGFDEECKNALVAFKRELSRVRTGRASGAILEGVQVDYYGTKTQLTHLGQISTPEPRLIVIQLYDASSAPAVEKAIQQSGLGFNPSREGNTIRIMVPPLTQEARRDIVKLLHKTAEEMRVSVRNHRRDANDALKKLEKDGKITKDEEKKAFDKVQKLTDSSIAEIDKMLAAKEAEVMEV